jgi:hypothetical protein
MSRKSKHAVSTENGNVVVGVESVIGKAGWLLAKVFAHDSHPVISRGQ